MTEKKLSIEEFQSLLEREYVQFAACYFLFSEEWEDKYIKKMEEGMTKILDISSKLGSRNIFTDGSLLDMYIQQVVPIYGILNLDYRSEGTKQKMDTVLKFSHYPINGNIPIHLHGESLEAEIIRNHINSDELIVKLQTGEIMTLPYTQCECIISREQIKSYINNNYGN